MYVLTRTGSHVLALRLCCLASCALQGTVMQAGVALVPGRMIRYVHLPSTMDVHQHVSSHVRDTTACLLYVCVCVCVAASQAHRHAGATRESFPIPTHEAGTREL